MPSFIISLIQYILAFTVLYFLIPLVMFRSAKAYPEATSKIASVDENYLWEGKISFSERFFANYMKIIFVVIVFGYLLVITRLFELLSMITIFLIIAIINHFLPWGREKKIKGIRETRAWFTDYIEGIIDLPGTVKNRIKQWKDRMKETKRSMPYQTN